MADEQNRKGGNQAAVETKATAFMFPKGARHEIAIKSADPKKPTFVEFECGILETSDPALIEQMHQHPANTKNGAFGELSFAEMTPGEFGVFQMLKTGGKIKRRNWVEEILILSGKRDRIKFGD